MLSREIHDLLRQEQLPATYLKTITVYLIPLVRWIMLRKEGGPLFIGINGGQGSGKSTMAKVLAILLRQMAGYHVARLSIDDLYLTHAQRMKLSQQVHALFETRGVPGTHDITLGIDIINQLMAGTGLVAVPQFDKRIGDRMSKAQWSRIYAPVDIVLFEGWCVATPPQSADELLRPINALEALEDKEGVWRTFVNHALANQYGQLFDMIDLLIFLKIPSFSSVFQWREHQEYKTFAGRTAYAMNRVQLTRFIQHYERLTRVSLAKLPQVADVVFELDHMQNVIQARYQS